MWSFQSQITLMGRRKLESFLGGRPTFLMFRSDSALPMRLKVALTNGKKATEAGPTLRCGGALVGGPELRESTVNRTHCPGTSDAGISNLAVGYSNHRSPWPCEQGWKVRPARLLDSGDRWHSNIDWCEPACCTLGVRRRRHVSCKHVYPERRCSHLFQLTW
jgi:hypothetical protein